MSELKNKDLHVPFSNKTLPKVKGLILEAWSEQSTAATAAGGAMVRGTPIRQDCTIQDLWFMARGAPAAGESMVIDVLVNGVSILTSTYTYDSTKAALAKTQISLMSLVAAGKLALLKGDVVTVSRTYVAGGGPTPIAANAVHLEVA